MKGLGKGPLSRARRLLSGFKSAGKKAGEVTRVTFVAKTNNPPINEEAIPTEEVKKRRRERLAIISLSLFFCVLTYAEIHLSHLSHKLPFVNSIFFFGLVNFNVALLLFLAFLIFRNVAKIFTERRGGLLGSRLKTKLVMAFVSF